ncbi:2,4-dienoyl-CoA reductase [Mycena vitilis]|nr:2,4-dienoyl-CoA reductase [Mycena vitilis]
MSAQGFVAPWRVSTSVFKEGIFDGKVVFCTGGGSGICRGMTQAMVRHPTFRRIKLTTWNRCAMALMQPLLDGGKLYSFPSAHGISRDSLREERLAQTAKELMAATGKKCLPYQADVRHPQALKDAVAKTIEAYGRIDFVICGMPSVPYSSSPFTPVIPGAGGNFLAPISAVSENAFRTVVEIDTLGTYHTIKATIAHVRATKGAYIHVSAMMHYKGTPLQAHVSAAKAGVDALSAALAVEEGPYGVRSNVVAPGATAGTEGMDRLEGKGAGSIEYLYPLGRMAAISDLENATVFLFSDAASYITGQILPVDGASEQVRTQVVPYPLSVLQPEKIKSMIKGKL